MIYDIYDEEYIREKRKIFKDNPNWQDITAEEFMKMIREQEEEINKSLKMQKNILLFDVESTSLHGTGFAVGAIVVNRDGTEVDRFELLSKEGAEKANDWVKQNVIPNLSDMPTCETDKELRDAFFNFYLKHKETAEVWSDVNFPVETNFLHAIVNDAPTEREWLMPYPLFDVSTLIDVSIDRCAECGIDGLRKHNPLDDSRASVYSLLKQLGH